MIDSVSRTSAMNYQLVRFLSHLLPGKKGEYYRDLKKRLRREIANKSDCVLIVGGGPSITNIDYSRLPKNCHIWRVNNFFFEDKYYVGRQVDAYFTYGLFIERAIPTLHELHDSKEYCINFGSIWTNRFERKHPPIIKELAISFNDYLKERDPEYHRMRMYWWHYFAPKAPSTGISAMVTAAALGYSKIMVAGFDLHLVNTDLPLYAWGNIMQMRPYYAAVYKALKHYHWNEKPIEPIVKSDIKPAEQKIIDMPKNIDVSILSVPPGLNRNHDDKYQLQFIEMLQRRGVGLYSVAKSSAINDYIPLAPSLRDSDSWGRDYKPKSRPQNAIIDYPPFPKMDDELFDQYNKAIA